MFSNIIWRAVHATYEQINYFRSTLQSRRNKVGLNVRLSTKSSFDFSEIWLIGRGQWVMHDGIQYDPILGQCQGHEPFSVGNPAI